MDLPTIRDFVAHAADPNRYARLGRDWAIAVADVVSSTVLADAGRDREVNFVAGAVVAALSAVTTRPERPAACQFGGDGAIAAIPPDTRTEAADTLAALAHWAEAEMAIPLRVGLVPVADLEDAGLEVRAALLDFGGGNAFGLFLGPGAAAAERWVKAEARRRITPRPGPLPGLDGLSCRWRPVPARRGVVLCVIVDPVDPGPAGLPALARLQAGFEAIVPTDRAAPLGDDGRLVPKLPTLRSLWAEAHTVPPGRRPGRIARALAGSAVLALGDRLGGRLGPVDVTRYRHALAERSDYRKQAGGPRFVLDVTPDEADRIEAMLAAAEAEGTVISGTARADATVMTCLVGDFQADRHVHFVDGAGLGFWRASVVLKDKARRISA